MRTTDYKGRILLVYWMPAVLWAAVVLGASSDLFSAKHSGDWLGDFILRIAGHPLQPGTFATIHSLIRKASHLTEYFVLGALCFRALRADEHGWRMRWAVVAIALAASVAIADEWHQMFVISRVGSGWDVVLDSAGAALAQLAWRYNSRTS